MKQTAVILTGCIAGVLLWASHPDNPSGTATTRPDAASVRLTKASSGFRLSPRESPSRNETVHPVSDGLPSILEEPERKVADEPADATADQTEPFWAFASYQPPLPDAPEPGMTLDQFDRPYAMTMTEAGFAQLSPADKSVVIDEVADLLRQARRDAGDTWARADADIACGNYDSAESALVSEYERLSQFNTSEEGLYLTRIVGISCQQKTLKKLETVYTQTGNDVKRHTTQQEWQNLEAQKRHMQTAQMEQAN